MPLNSLVSSLLEHPPPTDEPDHDPFARAAVAVVFRPGPDLLFIERSEHEGDPWSGHMAFPGGRKEPTDDSLRQTAERETLEEVGLDLTNALHHGPVTRVLTPILPTRPQMAISSYLYEIDRAPSLTLNEEVAATHWFALDRLLRGEGRDTFLLDWRGQQVEMPCVRLDGTFLWGLTLRMVDDMLERIAARQG